MRSTQKCDQKKSPKKSIPKKVSQKKCPKKSIPKKSIPKKVYQKKVSQKKSPKKSLTIFETFVGLPKTQQKQDTLLTRSDVDVTTTINS